MLSSFSLSLAFYTENEVDKCYLYVVSNPVGIICQYTQWRVKAAFDSKCYKRRP